MKRLIVRPTECTHCRNCELACAFYHSGSPSPIGPRVIDVRRVNNVPVPLTCLQCDDAACVKACPVGAIVRNPETHALEVSDRCFGCQACVYACPFGAMYFRPDTQVAIKCDLCQGNPTCAAFCPTTALTWSER
jgi:Fe-S-cluster-containing hydrogenase component 2